MSDTDVNIIKNFNHLGRHMVLLISAILQINEKLVALENRLNELEKEYLKIIQTIPITDVDKNV
jgi:hypothetical protein